MSVDDPLYKRRSTAKEPRDLLNCVNSTYVVTDTDTELLHMACKRGNPNIVWHLLHNGVDAGGRDDYGATPLHVVYYHQGGYTTTEDYHACEEIIGHLLCSGADINARDFEGMTPLHRACSALVAESLIEHGSIVNAQDFHGRTLLHYATDTREVATLLYHGAKINMVDQQGDTPLHLACRNQEKEVIEYFLCSGANMNCNNERRCTPLSEAVGHKKLTSSSFPSSQCDPIDAFEGYFIKMSAAGILNEEDNHIIPLARRWSAQKRETFRKSCIKEVSKLQEQIGDTGVTYRDVLMQLPKAFGDPRVDSDLAVARERFPIYWLAIEAARKSRKRLLSQSAAVLSSGVFRRLPEEITILICDYLTSSQLEVILNIGKTRGNVVIVKPPT